MPPAAPALDPNDLRAFVAIQTLGLCAALEAGALTPADAERWLFQNEMMTKLQRAGACEGCLGLVSAGADATRGPDGDAVAALKRGALAILERLSAGDE